MNTRETRSVALNVFETFPAGSCRNRIATPILFCWPTSRQRCNRTCSIKWNGRVLLSPTRWIFGLKPRDRSRRASSASRSVDPERQRSARDDEGNEPDQAGRKIRRIWAALCRDQERRTWRVALRRERIFQRRAYPLEDIHDPTGAGDTFAGGLAGYLAAHVQENVTFDVMRKAVIYGSVLASFCVEAFSLERLRKLTHHEIADRYQMFKMMSQFEVLT